MSTGVTRQSLCQVCKEVVEQDDDSFTHLDQTLDADHLVIPALSEKQISLVLRLINGGLRDAINTHGPIDKSSVSSASKRIYGMFKGHIALVPISPTNDTENLDEPR